MLTMASLDVVLTVGIAEMSTKASAKEIMMVDLATITAAIGAATAGVNLIDKIGDQISRFLTKQESPIIPVEHRAKIERDGDSIVQKINGVTYQRITAADLQKLPETMLRHIKVREQSMENHYAIWESVYPQLALAIDPIAKAKTEQQLKGIIIAMGKDLTGVLDFLMEAGIDLDDHYRHIRDLVANA
jgi:hypothetical protein